MARHSYLPPPPEEMFPSFRPDREDLESHQRNLVTLEWVSRVHKAIYSQEERLSSAQDLATLAERRGVSRGLREACSILETIASEIANRGVNADEGEEV